MKIFYKSWWKSLVSWGESDNVKLWEDEAKKIWRMMATKDKLEFMEENFCTTYNEGEAMYLVHFFTNRKVDSN